MSWTEWAAAMDKNESWKLTDEKVAELYDVPADLVKGGTSPTGIVNTTDVGTTEVIPAVDAAGEFGAALFEQLKANYKAALDGLVASSSLATFEFDASDLSVPNILTAFNGGITATAEKATDAMSILKTMRPDPQIVSYRLAADLCVWCGKPLPATVVQVYDDSAPAEQSSVCYCSPQCQRAWLRADIYTAPEPERDLSANPWHRPAAQVKPPTVTYNDGPPFANGGLIPNITKLVPSHLASVPHLAKAQYDLDHKLYEQAVACRPGQLAGKPEHTDAGFAVGHSHIYGEPALKAIDPEPEFATWPHEQLRHLHDDWRIATGGPGSPFDPTRHCPKCQHTTVPLLTANMKVAFSECGPPGEQGVNGVSAMCTRMVCGHPGCLYEYPVPLLPIYRGVPEGFMVDIGVVTSRGVLRETVAGHMLAQGVMDTVWKHLQQKVQWQLSTTPCPMPGCERMAEHWYALAAPLVLDHWQWQPTAGQPLRLGLCGHHAHTLYARVMQDAATHQRMVQSITYIDQTMGPSALKIY